jgi:hypothetical protein
VPPKIKKRMLSKSAIAIANTLCKEETPYCAVLKPYA